LADRDAPDGLRALRAAAGRKLLIAIGFRVLAMLATGLLWVSRPTLAAVDAGESAIAEIEVTGERAGPRLWRVSNGEHVVWLLGTLDPLPKQMVWRSHELESVLDEVKQVVPSRPDVDLDAGPITLLRTWLQWRRVQKLPDNATLQTWLSPALYSRWSAMKARYQMRDKDIDRQQPILAALNLYRRAMDVSKLGTGTGIEKSVLKLARQHKVRIAQTSLKVTDPRGLVTELGEIPKAAQLACLDAVLAKLEKDVDTLKAQANAWALGDVTTLRSLPYPREIEECQSTLENSGDMKQLIAETNRGWNAAVENALTRGPPTLAIAPIYELLKPEGTLARLAARGYRVEGP
jgi:uncharacterized protein YbaP (TraB family)